MSCPRATELTFIWEGRSIRLSYFSRRWDVIDHVEIRSADGLPLPITETGYKSHFFGPVDPVLEPKEVQEMVESWLNTEAAKQAWQDYILKANQLTLFEGQLFSPDGFLLLRSVVASSRIHRPPSPPVGIFDAKRNEDHCTVFVR